jgi:hypothetical protein
MAFLLSILFRSIHHTRTLGNNISLLSIWFLCFKAIVFVTWWQGVVIALLCATGITKKGSPFHPMEEQADMLQRNLQDFIRGTEVCFLHIILFEKRIKRREYVSWFFYFMWHYYMA